MDDLLKFFIGGSIAVLIAFSLLSPSLIGSMSEARLEYDSYGEVNEAIEFESLIDTFTNTSTLSWMDGDLVILNRNNTSGSFTVKNPRPYYKLMIEIRNPNPDMSWATFEINGETYYLSEGENEIKFNTERTDSFTVNLYKDKPARDVPVKGAAVKGIEVFDATENDYTSILGLMFVIFSVLSVLRFYENA